MVNDRNHGGFSVEVGEPLFLYWSFREPAVRFIWSLVVYSCPGLEPDSATGWGRGHSCAGESVATRSFCLRNFWGGE